MPLWPWQGKVGLYLEGDPATFNNVTVYGSTVKMRLLEENAQATVGQEFQRDREMQSWTDLALNWHNGPSGMNTQQYEFYGDHWMALKLAPEHGAGTLTLALNNDGRDAQSGWPGGHRNGRRAGRPELHSLSRWGATGAMHWSRAELRREISLPPVAHRHAVLLECNGETVLSAKDPHPVTRHISRLSAAAAYCDVRDVCVLGQNLRDYTFANAPVDWLGDGTWMPTVRWACSPEWSFLGGWSRGDAVLWHKATFHRRSIAAGLRGPEDGISARSRGIRSPLPRFRRHHLRRWAQPAQRLCRDLRRGGCAGAENQRTVLLRNGVEVASVPVPAMTFLRGGHHQWFALNLRKHGNTIDFSV